MQISFSYPTSKWPIPDGVQIPLWAQEDARLWTNQQFNSTEAEEIATSAKLIGLPLGFSSTTSPTASSTTSPTASSSTSLFRAMSTSSASTSAPPDDSRTGVGPIVGGVTGGVLGLLLIGVLIWWIVRRRQTSFEGASPSMSVVPFTDSQGPTPALVKMVVPVPQRLPPSYPSYVSSAPTTGHTELGDGNPVVVVQNSPGALDQSGASVSHSYGLTFSLPQMSTSATSVDQPPHANAGHFSQFSGLSPVQGQATLEPTPYLMPPLPQGLSTSLKSNPNSSQVVTKPRINPPGYAPPEVTLPSPLPNPAVQPHMTQPLNAGADINPMMAATPGPMSLNPPSYTASQAENREEQLRRAASIATAATLASSGYILLPSPSTPERSGDLLPPVPERAASPRDDEPDSSRKA
jgi:hypothetical protein